MVKEPALIHRFCGDAGKRLLIDALRGQKIVEGSEPLAVELADAVELRQLKDGERFITQDAVENDMFFIVAGGVAAIRVFDRDIAERKTGTHVGEMALIDPAARRSASVYARGDLVVGKISEPKFVAIADRHPRMWRLLGAEACERLRQRNKFVTPPNPQPVVFIGSSTESLSVARAIQSGLEHDRLLVRVWTDGVFLPSHYPADDLLQQVKTADFAVLVFSPDDKIFSRGKAAAAPRDNVVGEFFLFMGALGRERTLIVQPRGSNLKIPSDLLGMAPITYEPPGKVDELSARLGHACNEIRNVIRRLGCK